MPWCSDRLDLVADTLHGSAAWPLLQVAIAAILPGFQLAAVEPEKVEPLTPGSHIDHLGLRRVERQLQAAEDDPDPPQRLARLRLRPAQHDGIIGIPDQLAQLATAVFPDSIEFVEHHIRQHARDYATLGYALVAGKQLPIVQYASIQPLPQQLEHPSVADAPLNKLHEQVVI